MSRYFEKLVHVMIDIDPNTATQPQLQATMKALPGVLEVMKRKRVSSRQEQHATPSCVVVSGWCLWCSQCSHLGCLRSAGTAILSNRLRMWG